MMIKRFASYVALALCMCLGSGFASAMDRPLTYLASTMDSVGELHASAMTRHELTMVCWRTGSDTGQAAVASNLRADSNHFVMVSAVPAGVPDWDLASKA